LCSWARHLTLTVPLSTQVYKWVPVNCWGNLTNCGGMTCDGLTSCPGGVETETATETGDKRYRNATETATETGDKLYRNRG